MSDEGVIHEFFRYGSQYYLAGRYGVFASLLPVAANLHHHAIEMLLKGALSKSVTLKEMKDKPGHKLERCWEAFPGRAVHCALAFSSAARQLGLPLRAGLHTGEIEKRGKDIGGIAVHAAARVMSKSTANEVLVSRVVTDLVAGAGLRFAERGSHELKGLPGRWDLFVADST
jgi:class 3 adenylate cyclase